MTFKKEWKAPSIEAKPIVDTLGTAKGGNASEGSNGGGAKRAS